MRMKKETVRKALEKMRVIVGEQLQLIDNPNSYYFSHSEASFHGIRKAMNEADRVTAEEIMKEALDEITESDHEEMSTIQYCGNRKATNEAKQYQNLSDTIGRIEKLLEMMVKKMNKE